MIIMIVVLVVVLVAENAFIWRETTITHSLNNCIRESFQSIFKNSQNSTENDLLLQIINPINPQDTKDICSFIKESFTKRLRNI